MTSEQKNAASELIQQDTEIGRPHVLLAAILELKARVAALENPPAQKTLTLETAIGASQLPKTPPVIAGL